MPETQLTFEKLTGGKLREGYGLSEAPTASHCNPIYGENRVGSIGLPLPDAHRGETIKVWIVPKPGETLTEQEIINFCRKELARFEVPTAVEFRQELPKTMVGKVLRRMLVEEELVEEEKKKSILGG